MENIGHWIPEGASVAAVLIVVVAFLKHMRDSARAISDIADNCHLHQRQSQDAYEKSLDRLVAGFDKSTDRVVEQLKSVQAKQL
jgi:hypothetical protein